MPRKSKNPQILSIDFAEFRNTYQDGITPLSHPLEKEDNLCLGMNPKARVLVAYVPQENAKPFEELKAA